jgi:toxin ParE1/3/4
MKVVWSPWAQVNLRDIQRYYMRRNPQATRKLVSRIREAARLLEDFPYIGKQNQMKTCRLLQVPQTVYVLPYRVVDDVIDIMAVFDQRQERPDYLQ